MKVFYFVAAAILISCATSTVLQQECRAVRSLNFAESSHRVCAHIVELSSDTYMGRKPGTVGEEKTIQYIRDHFEKLGLEPGYGDSFFQPVELAEFSTIAPGHLILRENTELRLEHRQDFLLGSHYTKQQVRIPESALVFAGFGIHAPEIGWDDYKEVDVQGKIVVLLSGTPDEYIQDSTLWRGDPAANLYGQSFYKRNEAARRGAAGILVIYKQKAHSYWTWESLAPVYGQDDMEIRRDIDAPQLKFFGAITRTAARRLFEAAGKHGYDYQKAALEPTFQPVALGLTTQFSFTNTWTELTTYNVIARLPGTDLTDEAMLYTAHWDHVGISNAIDGDSICNGAVDNASGTGALIEIARVYTLLPPPRRSVYFIATGAEEMGLLGAVWYARHPVVPLEKTAASFNLDSHFPYGKTTHITGVVYGRSGLDRYMEMAAEYQGRILVPNTEQNIAQNIFFRSDHFPLAEGGVPSTFAVGAGGAMGHDSSAWADKMAAYMGKYHQVSDEYEYHFDCGGTWQDAELVLLAGRLMDREGAFPQWNADQPFQKWRIEVRRDDNASLKTH